MCVIPKDPRFHPRVEAVEPSGREILSWVVIITGLSPLALTARAGKTSSSLQPNASSATAKDQRFVYVVNSGYCD